MLATKLRRTARLAIPLIGLTFAQVASSTTVVVNLPSGTLNNHIMVACLSVSTASTITPPAGWTNRIGGNGFWIFTKTATGAEPANYTFTASASVAIDCTIATYAYGQYDVVGSLSSTTTPAVLPAATASVPSCLALACFASSSASVTFTTPSGYSAVASDGDGTATSSAIFSRSVSAGSTGTVSSTPSAGAAKGAILILKPR